MTDRPITGWTVQATCPTCGGQLAHVADGRPDGTCSRAVARCTHCARTWAVQMTITDASVALGTRPRHNDGCICAACTNARRGAA